MSNHCEHLEELVRRFLAMGKSGKKVAEKGGQAPMEWHLREFIALKQLIETTALEGLLHGCDCCGEVLTHGFLRPLDPDSTPSGACRHLPGYA